MQLLFTILSIWVIGSMDAQMAAQMMGNPQLALMMQNNPQLAAQMAAQAGQQQSATPSLAQQTAQQAPPAGSNTPSTPQQAGSQTLSIAQQAAAQQAAADQAAAQQAAAQQAAAQQAAAQQAAAQQAAAQQAAAQQAAAQQAAAQHAAAQQAAAQQAAAQQAGGTGGQINPQMAAQMNADPQMLAQMMQANPQLLAQMQAGQQTSATNPAPSTPQAGSAGGSTLSAPQQIAAAEASMASGGNTGSQTPTCTFQSSPEQAMVAAGLRQNCLSSNAAHIRPPVFCNGFVAWNVANRLWNMVSAGGTAPSASSCPLSQSGDIKIVSAIHGMYSPAGGMDAIAVTFNYPILPSSTFTMPGNTCPSGYLPPALFAVDGVSVVSATAQPATDDGEWSTVVLMGNFGSNDLAGKAVSVVALDFVTPSGCTKATMLSGQITYNIKLVSAKVTQFASCQFGLDILAQGGFEHADGTPVVAADFELMGTPASVTLVDPTGAEADENSDGDNYYKACIGGLTSPLQLQNAKLGIKSCSGANALYPSNGIHVCSSDDPVDIILPTMPNAGRR